MLKYGQCTSSIKGTLARRYSNVGTVMWVVLTHRETTAFLNKKISLAINWWLCMS